VYQFVKNAAFVWSVCVPDSCHSQDVYNHFSTSIYGLSEGLNVTISLEEADCVTIFDDKSLNQTELIIM
jgi:hypothetical protein